MKLESVNLPRLIGNHFRVTSVVMLCMSAYVIIPKVVDSTQNVNSLTAKSLSSTNSHNLSTETAKPEVVKDIYVPPNYGAPNSQRGSGTR
jgi:hypothetical protein